MRRKLGTKCISAILGAVMMLSVVGAPTTVRAAEAQNQDMVLETVGSNGHRYQIFNTSLTWTDAKLYCEELGGHLVTISSADELNDVVNMMNSLSSRKNCYWIGLYRESITDSWMWVTQEDVSYLNWASSEPNNYSKKGELYVHIIGNRVNNSKTVGKWNDATNEGASYASKAYALDNHGFICEWDDEEVISAVADDESDSKDGSEDENIEDIEDIEEEWEEDEPSEQIIRVGIKSKQYKQKSVAKKSLKFNIDPSAETDTVCKKVSGDKKLRISRDGTVTVIKGIKKGVHTMKVKIYAEETDEYLEAMEVVTIKVVIK